MLIMKFRRIKFSRLKKLQLNPRLLELWDHQSFAHTRSFCKTSKCTSTKRKRKLIKRL